MAETNGNGHKKNGHGKLNGKPRPKKKLTPKQEAFAENYLANGFNGVQAARDAGYQGSDGTLRAVASENLTKPNIASRVRARLDGLAANADEVLNLLGDHLRADHGDLEQCWKENGDFDLKKAKELGLSHLIKKIKRKKRPVFEGAKPTGTYEYEVELETYSAQEAASKLLPVLGLKQRASENSKDAERKKTALDAAVTRLIADGWDEAEARLIVDDAAHQALGQEWQH